MIDKQGAWNWNIQKLPLIAKLCFTLSFTGSFSLGVPVFSLLLLLLLYRLPLWPVNFHFPFPLFLLRFNPFLYLPINVGFTRILMGLFHSLSASLFSSWLDQGPSHGRLSLFSFFLCLSSSYLLLGYAYSPRHQPWISPAWQSLCTFRCPTKCSPANPPRRPTRTEEERLWPQLAGWLRFYNNG